MNKFILTLSMVLLGCLTSYAKNEDSLFLEHADIVEGQMINGVLVTVLVGNVKFLTDSGQITCDRAVWKRGENAILQGRVNIDDVDYKLLGDSVYYDIFGGEAFAFGKQVELWSYGDSLYAVGTNAYYHRGKRFFFMEQRPVFYVNYPDSNRMIEVIADELQYNANNKNAEGRGDVIITSKDMSTNSGCALINLQTNNLDLFETPTVKSKDSDVSGKLISIEFDNKTLSKIDVIDSARADINESVDTLKFDYDKSVLSGNRIIFNFKHGLLNDIKCYGQAYSWYFPASKRKSEFNENSISGDTIKFTILDEKISTVLVVGGAAGTYLTGKETIIQKPADTLGNDSITVSSITKKVDTIDYKAEYIEYNILDSLITLSKSSWVKSGTVSLDAYEILFDTDKKIVEAFSASRINQNDTAKSGFNKDLQPNNIPVILRDKSEEIYGNFLEYSIDTKKGRIVQSKSSYDNGYYYGDKLFREQENIFYVHEGNYTTCDADEPHFNFRSKNMKLIENDKLIARPVVLYIEKFPVAILPYYVFPLKRGRHSGLLPFGFGKFQRGDRYLSNVGYYWAASEYWDVQGAFDYYEQRRTMSFRGKVNFNKLYVFDGYLLGEYSRASSFNRNISEETKNTRWVTRGQYNHKISPTFDIKAYGDFQSDKTYYQDYSQSLEDRLNRETKSSLNFSKKFGKSTAIAGQVSHTVNLDRESRMDMIPSLNVSIPTLWLFGSGTKDEDGRLKQNWYNKITLRYSPQLVNFSSRNTVIDSIFTYEEINGDTLTDSLTHRSRKKYSKISHNPSLALPSFNLFKYFNFIPQFSYSETWFKIYETDQSLSNNIDASTTYRTYGYSTGVTMNTNLYGTVYPNILGLVGLRHVITPSMSYGYSPDIDKHPGVRAFAGGGAGSSKRQTIGISIKQLFQGKIKKGETEKNYDFLSVASNLSYNFENEDEPWSAMNTSFQSSIFRFLLFDGRIAHSFYHPVTRELKFFSPYKLNFDFNARLTLSGSKSIFDEVIETDNTLIGKPEFRGQLPGSKAVSSYSGSMQRGWNVSAVYSYSESGTGSNFSKRNFISFNLQFNLTTSTSVSYSQSYDFTKNLTVNNQISITKKIHCWTGSLRWIPTGSNRGFGFKLFVTAIPELKIDSNHDSFLETLSR